MTDDPTKKAPVKAALILFALVLSAAAQPQTITGKVVGVSDGDTITVLDDQKRQHKIRLDGIDAPESNQDFGQEAVGKLDKVFGSPEEPNLVENREERHRSVTGQKALSDGSAVSD